MMGAALNCSQTSVLKQNNVTQNIVFTKNSIFHHELLSNNNNQSKHGADGDSHHKHAFREETKRNESQMLGVAGSIYSGLEVEMQNVVDGSNMGG